ncbi:DUF2857 domain-containing protein [Ursidibacter maritimus]|uniref:DUF2857 domain-containing protein n=1 Tax=Ursidibacter maritimus TaxID=1331689 RepID=A0A949SZE0_9PAST|nr:DUF2857 domain-containing protein [Ursidibacter maritimus]KAE9539079.1 hypothetical protein A1D26_03340 [Ursidibacter maritimus]MBV6524635.1 DUF2857 domain-containing protein [Ursidibacter maritimus]MBV6526643.1 DUF2857 domain-containing protein [Ursidibacter maritimus]MBV6527073.1 DUF2857 domain-containing protein [Ursidibacter maritimus]MBV6530147.1 DUF2857 domain-containing protein [Ursidibacter maritimus]
MLNTTLNQAILSEILIRIRRGEVNYCQQFGFDESELAEITNLSTQEILDMSESKASFAKIQIDHSVFWSLLETVREASRQRNQIDRALTLGISSEMIHIFFGWSSAEVSARRKLLGIKENMGRKPNANEEEEAKIWELWQRHKTEEDSSESLDLLILIAEESDTSLTEIYRLVSQWEKERRLHSVK